MPRIIKNQVLWIVASVMLSAPRAALACSVCMGRSDDSATQGLNAAILTLLTVLLAVMGGVVGFIAYLIRRAVEHPLVRPAAPEGVMQ